MKIGKFVDVNQKQLGKSLFKIMKKNTWKFTEKITEKSWNFVSPEKVGNPEPGLTRLHAARSVVEPNFFL